MINVPPEFQQFFDACVGTWIAERTYHYVTEQNVERSRTQFIIQPLTIENKSKVMTDNQYSLKSDLETLPGYHLEFSTVSEKGDRVNQSLNFLFIPHEVDGTGLLGDYLRDRAYEEARPIISRFHFNLATRELLLTTPYRYIVSVDSIMLISPKLRVRKILNYHRPDGNKPLQDLSLAGFGVEQKIENPSSPPGRG